MAKVAPGFLDVCPSPNSSSSTYASPIPRIVVPVPNTAHDLAAVDDPQRVRWQWEHTSGWKDYTEIINNKIEVAYQRGEQKVRVKTGKEGRTPMVIFFLDMIQFDPVTHNQRSIRRVGPSTRYELVVVQARRFIRAWMYGQPRRELFSDFAKRKEQLYANIAKREYHVADYYHEDGWCSAVAKSSLFLGTSMTVVILNALWLAFDVDSNDSEQTGNTEFVFLFGEHVFCILFTVELLIRFGAFRRKRDCFFDMWFRLDFALVSMMVLETWMFPFAMWIVGSGKSSLSELGDFSIIRIARLTRLARVSRLLRACPEVITLLKGIGAASRSVFFTLMLLCIVLYVAALTCRSMVKGIYPALERAYFDNVGHAMASLLIHCTFLDGIAKMMSLTYREAGVPLAAFLLFVTFVSSFTVLNMLIGILVEVVSNVSRTEREESEAAYLQNNLLQLMEAYDACDNQKLGRQEFVLLMHNPDVVHILQKFGTNPKGLLSIADLLFDDDKGGRPGGSDIFSGKGSDNHIRHSNLLGVGADVGRGGNTVEGQSGSVECQERESVSFTSFLQLVSRLRGTHKASVTDIVELREYTRKCIKSLEDKIPGLQTDCSGFSNSPSLTGAMPPDLHLMPKPPQESLSRVNTPPPVSTLLVELDCGGRKTIHRHSSSLTIQELLDQHSHGERLEAMDVQGIYLGRELSLNDVREAIPDTDGSAAMLRITLSPVLPAGFGTVSAPIQVSVHLQHLRSASRSVETVNDSPFIERFVATDARDQVCENPEKLASSSEILDSRQVAGSHTEHHFSNSVSLDSGGLSSKADATRAREGSIQVYDYPESPMSLRDS